MTILKTEEIDALPSRHFYGYDWSEHPKVLELIEILFREYLSWAREVDGQQRIKSQAELQVHLTCLVLELYRTYKIHPEMALAISLGNETISGYQYDRYKPSHITFNLLNHIFDFLLYDGYVELPLGEKGRATGAPSHQRATRARATTQLIGMMDGLGINVYMIGLYPHRPECIELRKQKYKGQKRGDVEQYIDDDFTNQARTNLGVINDFISKHNINLYVSDEQEEVLRQRIQARNPDEVKPNYLDFTQKTLRRIFNNSSFEQGGRFYGGFWQSIPKEYRFLITIDGDGTYQYDYSGIHFAIMYARKGLAIPDDVYELDGYESTLRDDIKRAFNMILNCQSRPEAVGVINKRIEDGRLNKGLGDGESLLVAFQEKHVEIVEYIASGEGVRLQFIDSLIAERVMMKGIENSICILPIHDGFITTKKHQAILYSLMQEAFNEIMNSDINIKMELIYLELIDESQLGLNPEALDQEGNIIQPNHFNGKATSFSTIVGAEHILEQMFKYIKHDNREAQWARAASL